MKIIDNTVETVRMDTIPCGYTFCFENEIYMAVSPFDHKKFEYNAVCMQDGLMYRFQADAQVIPCVMQATVIKKGAYR